MLEQEKEKITIENENYRKDIQLRRKHQEDLKKELQDMQIQLDKIKKEKEEIFKNNILISNQ